MTRAAIATALAALAMITAPTAGATPPVPDDFPDVDSFSAATLGDYLTLGTHPSTTGYVFQTPRGVLCYAMALDDGGASCTGDDVGPRPTNTVSASTWRPGAFSDREPVLGGKILPVGSKLDTTNGIVCAVVSEDTVACRTGYNSGIDPEEHPRYGIHGFVVKPGGTWTF